MIGGDLHTNWIDTCKKKPRKKPEKEELYCIRPGYDDAKVKQTGQQSTDAKNK
jgi:hypothetical protein